MNITNHCIARYVERILKMEDCNETRAYINQNRDSICENINKTFQYAFKIYTGQINGDKSTKDYYIRDNIVMVADTDSIITLYKVDFSFGEDTDRIIIERLVGEIESLQGKISDKKCLCEYAIESKKQEVLSVEDEIRITKEKLFMLEHKRDTINSSIKVEYNEVELLNKQLEVHALKLCNSLEYKKDLLKLNGGK